MSSKQAACLNCRKSKVKCRRASESAVCERCQNIGVECVIPAFHIGRQKGVKNKRTGLDKAIHQIEEAIRKSKSDSMTNAGTLEQLQALLGEARNGMAEAERDRATSSPGSTQVLERDGLAQSNDDQLALDDAENPLQLLARASDLRLTCPQATEINTSTQCTRIFGSEQDDRSGLHRFFLPMKANFDRGPDLDPIDLGLVTHEEAEVLLAFFHGHLAHTRWGLDPRVHTLPFVRSRSAFLFTSLLSASALFLPDTAALARRLLTHRKYLAQQVIARRFRSVEIVMAFLVNIPWMHPGVHSTDDDTGLYISVAVSIALDLSLDKIVIPSTSFEPDLLKRIPKSHCIEAKRALAMGGFENVDSQSERGQRLLRGRERVWISLFVLERGICLARGRSYCVPITPLIKHCDRWYAEGDSHKHDGSLISMAVLRRDLDDLFSAVRGRCDSYRVIDVGSKVAQEIEATIDNFYNKWLSDWTIAIGEGDLKTRTSPYVEILVTHTRLSTYSGVINHPTAPLEVKRLFRASALSSALNVMRAAIQGEARLISMPNNTATMICFAACVSLNLSAPAPGGNHNLAPSVRNLIEETASVLERIGNTPAHRNGMSVMYGKYLRELVKEPSIFPGRPPFALNDIDQEPATQENAPMATSSLQGFSQPQYAFQPSWEPLQFSTMSGNEIIETVNHAGDFGAALLDFPTEDVDPMAWMNWMNPPEFGF
ncbi:hypothetical protein BCR34DRAFT_106170 [Clohesyomyces aquaticus]|uniref:Zn(2)-C6 fungal-type domain-containing protein n=1 Tax=Clohesyomyces aquaticus TaxID=1231657 RepID=A0A1Y2A1S8_9PLEO|nr:hypothetical protein BCR34DRAFT_106170 [Clohesyomyces aquaticus]